MPLPVDTLGTDARLATLRPDLPGLGIIEAAALAARDGRIVVMACRVGRALMPTWKGRRKEVGESDGRESYDMLA